MTATITLLEGVATGVADAFGATAEESVAFGFAGTAEAGAHVGLVIADAVVVPVEGFLERSSGHFRLNPRYVAEMTLEAALRNRSLVIMHSHPFGSSAPNFSPVDERMHRLLMPGLLQQLSAPTGSLVWSPGGWSGRVWRRADEGERATRIRIVGHTVHVFRRGDDDDTASARSERFDRQVLALGVETQTQLASVRVGIVGLGGTGSIAAQQLAHLGVVDYVLVDHDVVAESNLSRLVGATPADVGRAKTEVARRSISAIAPDARVEMYERDVRDCGAARAIAACDVVFSCTDSHASRALLTRLPYQYGNALIDMGTLVRAEGTAYVDVRTVTPATPCLDCQRVLDTERITIETQTPDQRELARRFGYAPGTGAAVPAILPVNTIAVSLAMLRLFDLLRPWLRWRDRVTIELSQLEIIERPASRRPECSICGGSLLGAGDLIRLPCEEPRT